MPTTFSEALKCARRHKKVGDYYKKCCTPVDILYTCIKRLWTQMAYRRMCEQMQCACSNAIWGHNESTLLMAHSHQATNVCVKQPKHFFSFTTSTILLWLTSKAGALCWVFWLQGSLKQSLKGRRRPMATIQEQSFSASSCGAFSCWLDSFSRRVRPAKLVNGLASNHNYLGGRKND